MAQPQLAPDMPATIRASEIVGRWGYAAFHRQEDRARTETAARGQCRQAVVINQGPGGGVMMYLADQAELQELRLKGGPNNRNFIGPAGEPAGGPQDREIVSFDGRIMLLKFTNPEIDGRYGTGIYVRCAPVGGRRRRADQKEDELTARCAHRAVLGLRSFRATVPACRAFTPSSRVPGAPSSCSA